MKKKANSCAFIAAKILRKLKLKKISKNFNTVRHNEIREVLNGTFEKVYETIRCNKHLPFDKGMYRYVWVFWWQGETQMPLLVKCCYASLKKQMSDKQVILITKNNIREYCTFPDYILKKHQEGKITLTHLSDILRFDLLSHYGGLYTDATVFWTGNIQTKQFENLYTCGGYSDEYYFNVSMGRWTGFLIGGCKGNPLFSFMYDFFLEYWKQWDELIDYFLIDYALNFAYENNIGGFKDYVDNIGMLNNPNLFKLMEIRNQVYTEKVKKELESNTYAFKLSYKKKFNERKDTYANRIIFSGTDGEV